jgi:hypothetical protein
VVNDNREAPGLVDQEGENPAQPDAESAPGLPGAKSAKDSSKKGLVMNVEVPTYREDRDLYAIPVSRPRDPPFATQLRTPGSSVT